MANEIFRGPLVVRYEPVSRFVAVTTGISRSPIALLPTPVAPFKAANWDNPVLARVRDVTLLTHAVQNHQNTLYPSNLPRVFRSPIYFRYEPKDIRVAVNSAILQNTLLTLTTPPPSIPNRPIDWTNPVLIKPNLDLRTFISSSSVWLIGQDQFYGENGQVPGFEFPQPVQYRGSELRGMIGSSAFNLLTSPTIKPFAQTNWPVPIGRPMNERTWLVNLQQSTLSIQITTISFPQKQWNWQGNAPLDTLTPAFTPKAWLWKGNSIPTGQVISSNVAWVWNSRGANSINTLIFSSKSWNWVKNTFNALRFINFFSKSWNWRGNVVTSWPATAKRLLMLLGIGR